MFNRTSRLHYRITTLAIALLAAIGILAPKTASAAQTFTICPTIIVVEYQENQLIMSCSTGVDFYGQLTNGNGCGVRVISEEHG